MKDGAASPAMLVETQFDPVKGTLLHVDLMRIAMDRKLKVSVPVHVTGEAKGVKTQGGILEVVAREVEIECLPADIPDQITVSVENLMLNEAIRISDLQQGLGEKVQLTGDPHSVIVHVVTLKAEEVAPVAAEAGATPAEPEVIKKGKATEEGEGAEPEKGEKKK
jgi:large subunit ribosomal protein L25